MRLILLLLIFSSLSNAQVPMPKKAKRGEYKVYQMHPYADISKLKGRKVYYKDRRLRRNKITREYREWFLHTYLPVKSKKLDEVDRDILFKSIVHLKKEHFFKKYKKLVTKVKYEEMKNELQK
jgi:hypothetical protein